MIPKIIHYCWFGNKKMPLKFKRYIKTWKKHCPDFELKLWNEQNYDLNQNEFIKEAARQNKWAFVTDFVRLDVIEKYGGIYLDTDVELIKPLTPLLNHKAFAGFECYDYVNFGLIVGAEPHNEIIKEMVDYYKTLTFTEESLKTQTCPIIQTNILMKHGLTKDSTEQEIEGFHIYPPEYFCPMNYYQIMDNFTKNTYSIHHYAASWFNTKDRIKFKLGNFKRKTKHNIKMFIKKMLRME